MTDHVSVKITEEMHATAKRCEEIHAPIEAARKQLAALVVGKIATRRQTNMEDKVFKINRVSERGGRLWLHGPMKSKTGWHSRHEGSASAGSKTVTISEEVSS